MKHIAIILILTLSFNFSNSQALSGNPDSMPTKATPKAITKDSVPFEFMVYQNAMLFGDLQVAKAEIFRLLTKYPDNIGYMDSLARIYFSLTAYPQSLLAAKIVLEKEPKNLPMLELSGIAYDAMGDKKEALSSYESLYKLTNDPNHLYQVAVLQFGLKRFAECETTADQLLKDPASAQKKITINIDNETQQEVPVNVAVLNLKGVLFKEMKQDDKARASFEEALKLMPDFALAKANLEMMNTKPAEVEKKEDKKEEKKKK